MLFLAFACQAILAIVSENTMEEDTEFKILDSVEKVSRDRYARTSKYARQLVKKHSQHIYLYVRLFDFPIQAANGCITGNKLRGFDPVACIRLITNPVDQEMFFHEQRQHAFTNAQLEILIFNAIEIGNIPVLNALLEIRSSKGAIEYSFLQDAICWASISQTMHRAPADRGFDFTTPRSIDDLLLNDICNLLVNFANVNGYAPFYPIQLPWI